MKFKTRLQITFITIILLPLALTAIAFFSIGIYLVNEGRIGVGDKFDYSLLAESMQDFGAATEEVYNTLLQQVSANASAFEDQGYLEEVNQSVNGTNSYILVRKNKEIYYSGNQEAAERIFKRLPAYGQTGADSGTGYYYNDMQKYVKQIDFLFADGSQGSIFIITKTANLISRPLLIDMCIAIALILLFTSMMLTKWIQKGVFDPINKLNIALQNIKEGNLDYVLETDLQGEIGDLYSNYEDMRLRLKESMEDNYQHEKQNRELISNISHDLKTPITAIKGYVEGIMDGVADTPEKMEKYIRTVYNKANDMDRLINELTVYSGIDSNRIPYSFHRMNVADYFGDCVEEVGLDLESKNIELHYSNLVETDTKIIADPEQMKKVINNIIGNSVKYMDKDKGIINIRILDEMDSIHVEIEDNGKGISAKDLPSIFERFYRTDTSRNSAQGGSGIGLSIVKKIIEDHGGYVWATSKEGEGTCIHFVIRKYKELQND